MEKLARQAGEICLRRSERMDVSQLHFKGERDLVTDADREVEDFLVAAIQKEFPDHDILGEETGTTGSGGRYRWVIDPIDGTTSYYHAQPYYSISIAWQEMGETRSGLVYGPALGQMFTAVRGRGAWLNGEQPLRVSSTTKLINSVWATGFACLRAGRQPNNLMYLAKVLPHIRDLRRCGSAALDLAYVAAGKYDGFWEMDLNLYDIAAGALMVEEAGGLLSDMRGRAKWPEDGIVASTPALYGELIALLQEK
ncbi:unnamed protein product [Cyprideis torosa]|uniref:Inositol-1-monophosphatase n=1 Tax=Cyprideis torosa TaxID=163714 RepID=A0A7R8ZUE6_9CRUS|nr:unnamed protein product [Cyprideis torosa]CAG0909495.1 unnamed protein product [Cyprideis torosa]